MTPTPTDSDVRDAICATLAGVVGVEGTPLNDGSWARVSDYERYAADVKVFRRLYMGRGPGGVPIVHGWHVSRSARLDDEIRLGRWEVEETWRLIGHYALDDPASPPSSPLAPTEHRWQGILDAAALAFRERPPGDPPTLVECRPRPPGSPPLEPLASYITFDRPRQGGRSGLQWEDIGPVMFAGVLCHSARGRLVTRRHERSA